MHKKRLNLYKKPTKNYFKILNNISIQLDFSKRFFVNKR